LIDLRTCCVLLHLVFTGIVLYTYLHWTADVVVYQKLVPGLFSWMDLYVGKITIFTTLLMIRLIELYRICVN
jgi:hypothetical protein